MPRIKLTERAITKIKAPGPSPSVQRRTTQGAPNENNHNFRSSIGNNR